MLHFGIVRPDERGLITNPLGLAAVRLTVAVSGRGVRQLKGLQLRWREAGDTEGEIEGWRNTQQGYGSSRQTRG